MKQKRCSPKSVETNTSPLLSEEMPVPPVYAPGWAAPFKTTSQSPMAPSPEGDLPAPARLTASRQQGLLKGEKKQFLPRCGQLSRGCSGAASLWPLRQISRKCPLSDTCCEHQAPECCFMPVPAAFLVGWVHRQVSYHVQWFPKYSLADFAFLPLPH